MAVAAAVGAVIVAVGVSVPASELKLYDFVFCVPVQDAVNPVVFTALSVGPAMVVMATTVGRAKVTVPTSPTNPSSTPVGGFTVGELADCFVNPIYTLYVPGECLLQGTDKFIAP